MTGRFLVTTADERSWKFDRPILFLGEWCRLYHRKHVWEGLDALVAEPYGLKEGQKERDLAYIQALSNRLLGEVVNALNAFHGTRHSLRYWNIVLGHWLQWYVAVTFNRYFTLEQALKNYDISGTVVFDTAGYHLATTDLMNFIYACDDDVWNHVFCAKILNFWGNVKTEVNSVPFQGVGGFVQEENPETARNPILKRLIRHVANYILPKLSRKRDAFIINSYLPLIEEIKLQLSFGQCPQAWRSPALKKVVFDPAKRRGFNINAENHTGFEQFVRSQLGEVIPICHLEGYDQLVQQVNSLPWPAEPQFIFTSNNFVADEVFKVWAGLKVEKGTPYFVGQHGNNYGTLLGSQHWPELVTCDKFLTWGWTNGNSRAVPTFVIKIAGRKQTTSPSGGLLLVELHPPYRTTPWDNYYEFGIYQEEQFRFVSALPQEIQQQLMVCLHGEYKKLEWSDEQRWEDRSPNTNIETGSAKIQKLITQSRLVVHSYDSTGILETLALNIPTLCFWQGGLDHLLPSAKPYYELLRNVGILADTPEQAAKFVKSHWDNVSEWWKNKKVQDARKAFCWQYAKTEKHPIRVLKKLLIQNIE